MFYLNESYNVHCFKTLPKPNCYFTGWAVQIAIMGMRGIVQRKCVCVRIRNV